MKKNRKLVLHRTTIAILTAPELDNVVGGATAGGPQSVRVTTKIEPCQWASDASDDLCTIVPS